ncbi:MAG TPA: OsmC family protein [Gammaproteobacteria bacterium]|nr:OsmC family protein [Gammaproteobacteria bacterium]
MSEYQVVTEWQRAGEDFLDNRYSRAHRWRFDGGIEVPASASPHIVPLPMSVAKAVDPEEAFVASLSSCHMLFFLSLAAKRGFVVEHYRDAAVGLLDKDASGKLAMTQVTLHPETGFSGDTRPDRGEILALHEAAHEQCFIAHSVKTRVRCEPVAVSL